MFHRLRKSQANLVKIEDLINQWSLEPLFVRVAVEGKEPQLSLADKEEVKAERYNAVRECVGTIQKLLRENETHFCIDVKIKRSSRRWRNYLRHVDYIISDALLLTIACSIGYLLDQTDITKPITSLFDVKLELFHPNIIFEPSLEKTIVNNFYDIMCGLVTDVYNIATLIDRVAQDQDDKNTYLDIVTNHEELSELKRMLLERVDSVITKANKEKMSFSKYSNIWTESRTDFLFYFLKFARQLDEEEMIKFREDEKLVKACEPTLEKFKEKIDYYESLYTEVEQVKKTKLFDEWFRVDLRPFRQTLLNEIKRWSWIFKKHLLDIFTVEIVPKWTIWGCQFEPLINSSL